MTRRMLTFLTAGALGALGCGDAWTSPSAAAVEGRLQSPSGASCARATEVLEALRPRLQRLNPAIDVVTTEAPPQAYRGLQEEMRSGRWSGPRPPTDLIVAWNRHPIQSAAACIEPLLPSGVKVVSPAFVSEQLALFAKVLNDKFAALAVSYPVFNNSGDRAVVLVTRTVRGGIGSDTELILLAKRDGAWGEISSRVVIVS